MIVSRQVERVRMKSIIILFASALTVLAAVPFDIGAPGPGSIGVSSIADSAFVNWKDRAEQLSLRRAPARCGALADEWRIVAGDEIRGSAQFWPKLPICNS